MVAKKTLQFVYIVLASLFFIIGVVGIFLPILPTTPFLLLTAYCLDRGSPRLHLWLINHRWFGPPILDWQGKRVIRVKHKAMASIMMAGSSYFVLPNPNIPVVGKLVYLAVIFGVVVFLWKQKSR